MTRSGSSAAQARACGPPPEIPYTLNVSALTTDASADAIGTTSAMVRPGCGVGVAVAGPVERDHAAAEPVDGGWHRRMADQAATGRAVHGDDERAGRVAGDLVGNPATVDDQ